MFLRLIQNFIAHHSPLTAHRSSLKMFFCPISISIAVVLRFPFKISSTAVAVYLHRPMQYICSEKPMRCLDKVTALHPLTHRIVFAIAPRCVSRPDTHQQRIRRLCCFRKSGTRRDGRHRNRFSTVCHRLISPVLLCRFLWRWF